MEDLTQGKFLDPESIIKEAGVSPGNVVADFGCGSGYFSLAAAQQVGTEGKVHALDVMPSALDSVISRAKILGITNISTSRVNLEKAGGSKLDDDSVDWVFLKDMLFMNKNKKLILQEAKRVLKPGGKAIVIEWESETKTVGPASATRVKKEDLQKMISQAGFSEEKPISAGDFHYGLIVKK